MHTSRILTVHFKYVRDMFDPSQILLFSIGLTIMVLKAAFHTFMISSSSASAAAVCATRAEGTSPSIIIYGIDHKSGIYFTRVNIGPSLAKKDTC